MITAWRNDYDYNCKLPRTAHETTTASVRISTTAPTTCRWKWVTTRPQGYDDHSDVEGRPAYNDKSETSNFIWEEKHSVTIDWVLKKNYVIIKPGKKDTVVIKPEPIVTQPHPAENAPIKK